KHHTGTSVTKRHHPFHTTFADRKFFSDGTSCVVRNIENHALVRFSLLTSFVFLEKNFWTRNHQFEALTAKFFEYDCKLKFATTFKLINFWIVRWFILKCNVKAT